MTASLWPRGLRALFCTLAPLALACSGESDSRDFDAASSQGDATVGVSVVDAAPAFDASPSAKLDAGSAPVLTDAAKPSVDAAGTLPRDASVLEGGSDAGSSIGPSACLPKFKPACTPEIVYSNEEPMARGAMFDRVFADPKATLQDALCTVCSILYRDPAEIPMNRRHRTVNLTLRDNGALADAGGNTIRIDVKHIEKYRELDKARTEFFGILVHEGAHLYQHYGNNGLGEGMADFVRIRAGFYEPGRRRPGGAWTDPYTTSGFFFSWLAGPGVYHRDGRSPHDIDIGYKINRAIGEAGPSAVPPLLMSTFGKDVEALWREYQQAID